MSDRLAERRGQGRIRNHRTEEATRRRRRLRQASLVEGLEPRMLLAVTLGAGQVIDVTKLPGNQSESAIAINPINPDCITIVSNNNAGKGLVDSYSNDGGATWTTQTIADGFGTMVPALRDPSLAYDSFGNLFLSYLDSSRTGVEIAVSTDCGKTFECLATLTSPAPRAVGDQVPRVDRPRVAVGDGNVAVVYQAEAKAGELKTTFIAASGAQVTGLGASHVTGFSFPAAVPGIQGVNFPSIAISPTGTVVVSFQDGVDVQGAATIFTSVFSGGVFSAPKPTEPTNIGGVDQIPPQPIRGIDAEAQLAYDLSAGPNHGRLYMVYTNSPTIQCGDQSVYLVHSDDNGANWSAPLRVNDNTTESANFQPAISIDPVTGHVAISFYSARNDPGFGPGDRDGLANDDVELFAALSTDGGATFSPNVQVSSGPTSAAVAGHNGGNDLGDYTGVAVNNDVIFPAWSDNSSTLPGNPDPNNLDIATARVSILDLIAHGTTLNLITGVPFQGAVATFTDVDPLATTLNATNYAASINWGDGTTSAGIITSLGETSYSVSGSHTYTKAKTYPITVTILDTVDGKSIVAQSTALVKTVAPPSPFTASLTTGAPVDVNRQAGNQSEEAIAINPTNPLNIVVLANQNAKVPVQGRGSDPLPLVKSVSFDGGLTWTTSNITDGYGHLVPGFGDPSLAFDNFGNLFASYLDSTKSLLSIALSTDGGNTFIALTTFEVSPHARNVKDQPTITTGPGTTSPGTVWVTFKNGSENPTDTDIKAVGAPVFGKGLVGFFGAQEDIPGSAAGNFGDITVGPDGQVLVTFQQSPNNATPTQFFHDEGPSMLYTSVDPDGLGGAGFGASIPVPPFPQTLLPFKTSTTFVGEFDDIPAQVKRTIDAEVGIAYDRSGGPFNGRVYMVYTDASALRSPNTDIYVRYSDNNGLNWSNPLKVNDDNTENSQFFPKIAVDQTTGHVGISWYDARNDPGFGPGDRNGHANDDVEVFAAVSIDGGVSFSKNIQVANGPSEAAIAGHNNGNDFGDYMGLAFFRDALYPAWADNSTTLAGNPDPNNFDIATAHVSLQFNIPITGMPNPFSITGVLNGNKVTNNNQPNFVGTTIPGSLVQLFALANGQTTPFLAGQTTADALGNWSITTIPLPDGTYTIFVQATDPAGHQSPLTQILPGGGMGQLIIDTIGPRVTGAQFSPGLGQIMIAFQDERSGLDQLSLMNPANYILRKQSRPGEIFAVTNIAVSPQTSLTAPQVVVLTINNGQKLRGVDFVLDVRSGGIKDLAGNALDGEFFGLFPSGNGRPGGDFVARLDSIHGIVFPAQPVISPTAAARALMARRVSAHHAAPHQPLIHRPARHIPTARIAHAFSTSGIHRDTALSQPLIPGKRRRGS